MKYSVVHHSASQRDNTSDSSIASWMYYNRVILNNGTTVIKHDNWHTRGNGNESKDYCLVGNFMNEEPTEAQITSLKRILKDEDYPIIGHRQIASKGFTSQYGTLQTLCPGDNLFKLLPTLMSDTLRLDIDYSGKHQQKVIDAFDNAQTWYAYKNIDIGLSLSGEDDWATVLAYDGATVSGGCSLTAPYRINLRVGLAMPYLTLGDIFIHEIMHGLFFDAGLGDIHEIKTSEYPRGLTLRTAKDNEYNFNYYLSNTTMVTEEILRLIYLGFFGREPDEGAKGYIGQSLPFVLNALLGSSEKKEYNKVISAVKGLENWARSN